MKIPQEGAVFGHPGDRAAAQHLPTLPQLLLVAVAGLTLASS